MLTVFDHQRGPNCEGISRRDFLRVGSLGLGGFSLPWLLQQQSAAADSGGGFLRNKSVVLLFLSGGASHIETFNPNMDMPAPYRSVTGEVQTKLPGVTFGGTFPQLATFAEQMSIVRSFQHPIGGHEQAIVHVLTGGTDSTGRGTEGFSMGSTYMRLRGANHEQTGMPTFALLNSEEVDGQYQKEKGRVIKGSRPLALGSSYAPFNPGGKKGKDDGSAAMELRMERSRFDHRRELLSTLDSFKTQVDIQEQYLGLDRYTRQAFDLILGSAAEAFDLSLEDPKTVDRYDTSTFRVGKKRFKDSQLGKHFLTARRLIEAGCGFVTIHSAGWDMHADGNNPGVSSGMEMLGRPVDHAVSAFLEDLQQRGLSEKVLLVTTGDFGRTPKINGKGGRDHWPRLCTLAFAGGGLNHGQVIGQSARNNDVPQTTPISPAQLRSTLMHTLFDMGILRVTSGIPRDLMTLLEEQPPIDELF